MDIEKILDEVYKKAEYLKDLQADKDCREYLFYWRWPKGFECPKCNYKKKLPYYFKERKTFRCKKKKCKSETSVIAGTVFEGTRLPLSIWFLGAHIIKRMGDRFDVDQFRKILRIKDKRTASRLYKKIKVALKKSEEFKSLFGKKTRNLWKERKNPSFPYNILKADK